MTNVLHMIAYLISVFSVASAGYVLAYSGAVMYEYARNYKRGPLPKHVFMVSLSHIILVLITAAATALEPHGYTIPSEVRVPGIALSYSLTVLALKKVHQHRHLVPNRP